MQCDDDGERRSACYASDIDHADILLWPGGGSGVSFNFKFRRPGGFCPVIDLEYVSLPYWWFDDDD